MHVSEEAVEPAVADWFRDHYGADAVETQVYQPEPYWFVDLVVDVSFATLFIEVENDADSVRRGVAQAAGYAGADIDGVPVVITPKGHVDPDRLERLQRGSNVLICEFDLEHEEFV